MCYRRPLVFAVCAASVFSCTLAFAAPTAPKKGKAKAVTAAKRPAKMPVKAAPKRLVLAVKPAVKVAAKPAAPKPAAKPAPIVINSGLLLGGSESAMVEVIAGGKGRINYEANVVKAVGLGALPPPTLSKSRAQDVLSARNAALVDAVRTLGMAVSRVRVSSDSRVQNFILQSDEVRLRVHALVADAQVVDEKYLPTSGVFRIVVQMSLTGPNSVSEAVGIGEGEAKTGLAAETAPESAAASLFAPGAPAPANARYTSIVVDCRGLKMESCMSPRLYQKSGAEVYGTMQVPPDYVIETGIAAFPRSLNDALRTSRTGNNPLMVRACGAQDRNRFYAVISDDDAEKVREANRDSHFFERTAVVFLLDPTR